MDRESENDFFRKWKILLYVWKMFYEYVYNYFIRNRRGVFICYYRRYFSDVVMWFYKLN